jgi:hypothetical protein
MVFPQTHGQQVFVPVCVLGMHRSGTSCLTGSLQKAGLDLGNHSSWNRFNQRGNRENPEINDLHDDLLAFNGGSWDAPPERLQWGTEHEERARRIAATYPPDVRWGFKDPKTLTALEGWRRILGPLQLVGIYRHPVLVAYSLAKRNKVPLKKGLALWQHYNRLLLVEHDKHPFPLLCFDWDEETFHAKLNEVLPALGLSPVPPDDRFFTRELRHYETISPEHEQEMPETVSRLFETLQSRTL